MQVKINSYITTSDLTEEQAIEQATSMVDAYDTINENRLGEVVTKLYYIVPTLGKILVVVNEADKTILGVESNILANTNISDYPLERLPANVIDYKELIVKVGSTLTTEQIFNAGQSIVEETAEKSMPYKIPVLKVINYNNTDVDALVMPSIFGSNIFSSIGGIVNGGDAEAGSDVITDSDNILTEYNTKIATNIKDFMNFFNTDENNTNPYISAGDGLVLELESTELLDFGDIVTTASATNPSNYPTNPFSIYAVINGQWELQYSSDVDIHNEYTHDMSFTTKKVKLFIPAGMIFLTPEKVWDVKINK